MINLSLIEKLKMIISMIKNNRDSSFIIPIIGIICILIMIACYSHNKKINRISITVYLVAIIAMIYLYRDALLGLFDYMIENIVSNLLFPNLAIYIGVLITINIIVITSILSKKIKTYIKTINIVCYAIIQVLLFFIINTIITKNINVYDKLTIYSNQELLVLVETSMQVFAFWILILLVIKICKILINKTNNKDIVNKNPVNEISYGYNYEASIKSLNNRVIIDNYQKELIEYVPIKKKEFRNTN